MVVVLLQDSPPPSPLQLWAINRGGRFSVWPIYAFFVHLWLLIHFTLWLWLLPDPALVLSFIDREICLTVACEDSDMPNPKWSEVISLSSILLKKWKLCNKLLNITGTMVHVNCKAAVQMLVGMLRDQSSRCDFILKDEEDWEREFHNWRSPRCQDFSSMEPRFRDWVRAKRRVQSWWKRFKGVQSYL